MCAGRLAGRSRASVHGAGGSVGAHPEEAQPAELLGLEAQCIESLYGRYERFSESALVGLAGGSIFVRITFTQIRSKRANQRDQNNKVGFLN